MGMEVYVTSRSFDTCNPRAMSADSRAAHHCSCRLSSLVYLNISIALVLRVASLPIAFGLGHISCSVRQERLLRLMR